MRPAALFYLTDITIMAGIVMQQWLQRDEAGHFSVVTFESEEQARSYAQLRKLTLQPLTAINVRA